MQQIDRKKFKDKRLDIRRSVMLTCEMLYSEAFRALTVSSVHLLFRFMQKRTWNSKKGGKREYVYSDYENGGLKFPYSEAKILGFPESTFNRSIDQLCEYGFLTIEYTGGTLGDKKDYTRFKYLENWKDYGKAVYVPGKRPKLIKTSSGFQKINIARKLNKSKSQSKLTVESLSEMTEEPLSKMEGRAIKNDCGENVGQYAADPVRMP